MENNQIKNIFTITIIGDGKIKSICLNDYNKQKITFGRTENNDIILNSNLVSAEHGFFNVNKDTISIYDNQSKNGIFVNNHKCNMGFILDDGYIIKIDNPDKPLMNGIIMIVSINNKIDKWHEYNLQEKQIITIGRSPESDIVLDKISISLKHAVITSEKNNYYINSNGKNNIILNNKTLTQKTKLQNKDIIIINNIMLIYNDHTIIYRKHDPGVQLNAIDITKTVRVKGKKKDISQHVDFMAKPGEFIAFIGGSGAGKSTFLKCISGVAKPTSGQVLINGNDLFDNYDALKNLIGYVPQDNIIFENLTLIDMLKYAANLRMPDDSTTTEKNNRIKDVLETVELSDKKDVMIKNLSGGQKKRACIAVELIAEPKLFFLDEPTSGLDPGTERSLMQTLRKMSNSGKTIILVTHNTLNLHLCDRVVFFGYGGKVCFNGKPSEALNFFKVNDFVDIYSKISDDTNLWHTTYNNSSYKIEHDIKQIKKNHTKTKKNKSFINQFFTLLCRKFKTLINNKQQLLLMFGQAPLIGLLLSIVVTDNLFYSYEETKAILFTLSTASIWIGLLNSIQEVCSERVILEKEYMADLRLDSYFSSKFIYLLVVSLIQSILLIISFTCVTSVPTLGLIYKWYIESIFIVFTTIFSASMMGLFVSSIAKDTAVTLTMPALLLVPQLLFSGMLFPLNGIVNKISNFILCRWSVEALGTINDLNSLISSVQEAIPGYIREIENYYTFTLEHLTYDISIIIIMALVFLFASYCVLKYQLERGK